MAIRNAYVVTHIATGEEFGCNAREVSKLLGVTPNTISKYLCESEDKEIERNGYRIVSCPHSCNYNKALLDEWDRVTEKFRRLRGNRA